MLLLNIEYFLCDRWVHFFSSCFPISGVPPVDTGKNRGWSRWFAFREVKGGGKGCNLVCAEMDDRSR